MVRQADDEMTAHISPWAFACILALGIYLGVGFALILGLCKAAGRKMPKPEPQDRRMEP